MVWVKKLRELSVLCWFIKLWHESINIWRWSKILRGSLRGSEGVWEYAQTLIIFLDFIHYNKSLEFYLRFSLEDFEFPNH